MSRSEVKVVIGELSKETVNAVEEFSEKIREDMEKVDSLVADIATLDGETITAEDQEILLANHRSVNRPVLPESNRNR